MDDIITRVVDYIYFIYYLKRIKNILNRTTYKHFLEKYA